jgi:phage recombination protein Bet
MSNVTILPSQDNHSAQQIKLIRQTIANDCNDGEFNLFMAAARSAGLDPFRKQISPLIFNKDKPDKRRMSIITTIDGLRSIAARSGRYRPDDDEPDFSYDPEDKGPTNPLGLGRAKVRIYTQDDRGAWHPVIGVAYWSEFAPVTDEWAPDETGKRRPTGKKVLDTGGNWGRMPRVMLAKCAESQALRKAFPDDLSGLYEASEFDRTQAGEMLPSEVVAAEQMNDRLARIGGVNGIMFQMFPNAPLEMVELGQIFDRCAERIDGVEDAKLLAWFEDANRLPLQEFWARSPGDALELKKLIERQKVRIASQVPE